MVHATVKRESLGSFTVTFGDPSSPEAASGTITKKMSSTSSASSQSASTANVNRRKAQAIAMAKDAVLYARDAVLAVGNTDTFMISSDSKNKENLLQSKNLAYKAASKGITAIVMLRKLGLVPDGDEKGGMQEYVTKMVQQSKILRDSNEPRAFEKAREEFSTAVNGFEQSITTVNSRNAIPKKANSSDSTKKAADAVRMAYAAIEKAKAAIIGYDTTTLYSNNAVGTRISEPVIALQDAAEAAMEAAAMNDTNTDMTTHSQRMTDSANLFWITIRMGSDKLSRTIEDFERSTAAFSKAAGIGPSSSSGTAASAAKSTSATPAASKTKSVKQSTSTSVASSASKSIAANGSASGAVVTSGTGNVSVPSASASKSSVVDAVSEKATAKEVAVTKARAAVAAADKVIGEIFTKIKGKKMEGLTENEKKQEGMRRLKDEIGKLKATAIAALTAATDAEKTIPSDVTKRMITFATAIGNRVNDIHESSIETGKSGTLLNNFKKATQQFNEVISAFATATNGGRRTHRKRTHHKQRTHHKRTHRKRK